MTVDFGLMFFFCTDQQPGGNKYRLLLDAARFADRHGFSSIWTPERHFHKFGGLFPNPSVVSAALAMVTERLQLRAGSLVSPLHDVVRIAEEWAVVDNLSGGRVAISFGSGWNVNDFIFFPERYAERQAVMYGQIETLRRLWQGESIVRRNSQGKDVEVRIYPEPVQAEPPVWITSSGNAETFASAGSIGANVLTHLIGQDLATLEGKIARYRQARAENGLDPQLGKVSLMLHTFLGPDAEEVKRTVRAPFREYLRSAISLEEKAAQGGGVISGGHKIQPHEIPHDMMEELLDMTFERYFRTAALMGTPDDCRRFVGELTEVGVDEVACLVDFLDDYDAVMGSLQYLDQLRAACSDEAASRARAESLSAFVEEL
jgi:natural product biosynthesis luciferase-like monooxygenase protein